MHTWKEPNGFTTRLVGITASIGWWHESMYLVIHLLGHSWWYCMSLFYSCYPYRKGQMVQMLWESDCFPWLANASDITAVHAMKAKRNWSSFQLNCLHNWTWNCICKHVCTWQLYEHLWQGLQQRKFPSPRLNLTVWPKLQNQKKSVRHSSNVSWQ